MSLPFELLLFAAAAGAIWVAGVQLSDQTDVLATRLGLGSALGGLILLALATNLPEIAIVASAALAGDVGVAVGNILGGSRSRPRCSPRWTRSGHRAGAR